MSQQTTSSRRYVSIRAPARGATAKRSRTDEQAEFQSALPRGERPSRRPTVSCSRCFNPRSRAGSDERLGAWAQGVERVSIRAPARGATSWLGCPGQDGKVSIRAPARGATWTSKTKRVDNDVSIRAPARGATQPEQHVPAVPAVSIRAPARGATMAAARWINEEAVSIRAPARGATVTCAASAECAVFQSALPRGERPGLRRRRGWIMTFQSALPRGERPKRCSSTSTSECFNPRSRAGSDPEPEPTPEPEPVSIRAPARGATL